MKAQRKLKEQILELREQGLSTGEIIKKLNCSRNIIWYHFNSKKEEHREERLRENLELKKHLQIRIRAFQTVGPNNREYNIKYRTHSFTVADFLDKFGEITKCGISGKSIDLKLYDIWSLDHKIPKKQGGDNSLDNCQIVLKEFNFMKSSFTEDELIENCKIILLNKGFNITQNEN